MSVKIRPYRNGGWEIDIRVTLPTGKPKRKRVKCPLPSKSAAQRWAEDRERHWYHELTHLPELVHEPKEVPTVEQFWPRFMDGYARANRQKPSGIAAKETIGRIHLIPRLGSKRLDTITTEDVQCLKRQLEGRSPKTVNNILVVLNVLLKKAVEWDVVDRMPCAIRLLRISHRSAGFYDFDEYERLVAAAKPLNSSTHVIVLLGGDAGLRCGEMMALQWNDVEMDKRQLCVQRSDWKGHVSLPKGGRHRYVPLTIRLAQALGEHRHLRSNRVLCQADGSPTSADIVKHHVERAARHAGLDQNGVHRLRHTFVSHLAMRGAPARAIQELAGHKDLATTQRYMHLSPAALDSAIRLLDGPAVPRTCGEMLETADA
jgi:integrase